MFNRLKERFAGSTPESEESKEITPDSSLISSPPRHSPTEAQSAPRASSLLHDLGYFPQATIDPIKLANQIIGGTLTIKQALLDGYFPDQIFTALIDLFNQQDDSDLHPLLEKLLVEFGSKGSSLQQSFLGFDEDESDDEIDLEEEGDEKDSCSHLPSDIDIDAITSTRDVPWEQEIIQTNQNRLLADTLFSKMIRASLADLLVTGEFEKSEIIEHVFIDPAEKMQHGFSIRELLLQGYPPAVLMLALEQCYEKNREAFDQVIDREKISFPTETNRVGDEDFSRHIEYLLLNPSTSINTMDISFADLVPLIEDDPRVRKVYFSQLVRACMFTLPIIHDEELGLALDEYRDILSRGITNAQGLKVPLTNLLLLGANEEQLFSIYENNLLVVSTELSDLRLFTPNLGDSEDETIKKRDLLKEEFEIKKQSITKSFNGIMKNIYGDLRRGQSKAFGEVAKTCTQITHPKEGENIEENKTTLFNLILKLLRTTSKEDYSTIEPKLEGLGLDTVLRDLINEKFCQLLKHQLQSLSLPDVENLIFFQHNELFSCENVELFRQELLKPQPETELLNTAISWGLSPRAILPYLYKISDPYHQELVGLELRSQADKSLQQTVYLALNPSLFMFWLPIQQVIFPNIALHPKTDVRYEFLLALETLVYEKQAIPSLLEDRNTLLNEIYSKHNHNLECIFDELAELSHQLGGEFQVCKRTMRLVKLLNLHADTEEPRGGEIITAIDNLFRRINALDTTEERDPDFFIHYLGDFGRLIYEYSQLLHDSFKTI